MPNAPIRNRANAPAPTPTSANKIVRGDRAAVAAGSSGASTDLVPGADPTPAPSGGGNVTGPGSAVDGDIAVFDGTTGKKIKDSGLTPLGLIGSGTLAGAFGLLTANAVFTQKTIAYPGGGTIQVRFDLGNFAFIACGVGTLNLSPAGSAGLVAGRSQSIFVENTSGGNITLTLNPNWTVAGGAPALISAGQNIELFFFVNGTAETDVSVGIIISDNFSTTPAGPIGDGTHVAQVTVDAKGRVTALASVAISFPAAASDYPFNVKNYGAVGDGSTDDTAAIQNACNALTTAGRGCLFFPDGRYIISSTIILGSGMTYNGTGGLPYNANWTIRGSGRNAAVLIQTTNGQGGIYVNLTGGSNIAWNRAEVVDLGIRVANGVTGSQALMLDYGVTPVVSAENVDGSTVHGLDIGRDATGFSKGWTTGIFVQNPWKASIFDIHAFGCDDGNVVPTSGAGSGAAIQLLGGFNVIIDHIYGSFWLRGMEFDAVGGSGVQGFMSSDVIFVAVQEGIHVYPGAVVTSLCLTNWLVDQGNSPNAGLANVAFYIDGDSVNKFGSCTFSGCNFFQVGGVAVSCGILLNNISYSTFQGCNGFASGTSGWCQITGTSEYNVFNGCIYGSHGIYGSINLGAGTDNNQFNNTQGATFTNGGGGGNTNKTTMY